MNALCLGMGLAGGWALDRVLRTTPIFIFLGLAAGIALGVVATYWEIKKYL